MAHTQVLARFPSASRPSVKYELRLARDGGSVYCTCPAWRFQRKAPVDRVCKHMIAAATTTKFWKAVR